MAATSTDDDEQLLQAVLSYLKKKNLQQTEQALRKEADIQGDEDSLHVDKMKQVLTTYKSAQHQERALSQFGALCQFVEKSLEMYRGELSLVIYPLFVQIYLELILGNQPKLAREFFEKYKGQQEGREDDLNELTTITTKEALQLNSTFSHFRSNKYVIRMCKDSFNCLLSHLQDNSHVLLLNLINLHLYVDVFDGLPKQPSQLALSNSTMMGDGMKSVNQQKMHYGVIHPPALLNALLDPDEFDDTGGEADTDPKKKKKKEKMILATVKLKDKTESHAPIAGRIPYPPLTEADIAANNEMIQELSSRYRITHGNQPTIAFYTFLNAKEVVNCASLSEDCKLLAAGCQNSAVKVWSLTRNKIYRMKEAAELESLNLADENIIDMIMDERTGTQSLTLHGHIGPVYDTSPNYNKSLILSCGDDCTARLWSLQTHTQLVSYRAHEHTVWRCAWSPLGHYFATGGADRLVILWSMQHIAPIRLFSGHLGHVTSLCVHPNGNYVASGSSDRSIRVWDMSGGSCVRQLTGHKGTVTSLVFSPHGHLLISGDEKGAILVWDLSNGSHIATLSNHTDSVTSLAMSREGGTLISGGMDCVVNTWDMAFVVDNCETELANEDVLINMSKTKDSPVLHLGTTRKNFVMGVGKYSSFDKAQS